MNNSTGVRLIIKSVLDLWCESRNDKKTSPVPSGDIKEPQTIPTYTPGRHLPDEDYLLGQLYLYGYKVVPIDGYPVDSF